MEDSGKHPPRNSGKSWLISKQRLYTEIGNCKIVCKSVLVPHLLHVMATDGSLHSYLTADQLVQQNYSKSFTNSIYTKIAVLITIHIVPIKTVKSYITYLT